MAAVEILKSYARADRAPGFSCGRYFRCKGLSLLDGSTPPEAFVQSQWDDFNVIKSSVGAVPDDGARELVQADFLALLRPLPILTRLGIEYRPFGRPTIGLVGGNDAAWIPEGASIPVNGQSLEKLPGLRIHRVGAIDVVTRETLMGSPRLDQFIGSGLATKVARSLDVAFIDPSNTGGANAPASITAPSSSLPTVAATGDAQGDITALLEKFEGDLLAARFIMHPLTAVEIGAAFNGSGTDTKLGVNGGVLCGIPTITSQSVPRDSSGGLVTIVDVSALAIALEIADLSVSVEGVVIMDDAPAMNSTTPTGVNTGTQALVSLWQTGSVGLSASAHADWNVQRSGAVATLTGASYPSAS